MSSEQQRENYNMVGRDIRSFQKEIEILQKQLDGARRANVQLREASIERMQEVFQVCQDRLDVQNKKMQEMRDVCRGQNNMLQETCTQIQTLEQELVQQRQQVSDLQEQKGQSDEHINSLETVNQNLQVQNQKLQAQSQNLQEQNSQLEKDMQGLEEQCNMEVEKCQLELENYGRQLQELEVLNRQLRTDNDHLKSQYEAIAQCNNILVGIGSRPEGEEVNRSGVQQIEERSSERGQQAKSTATFVQQEKDDSLNNQGSSNKENTPMQHQNRPKILQNLGSTEKIHVPDAGMTTQQTGNVQNAAAENLRMQVDGVEKEKEEDEADEMNLSMDLVQGSRRTQQNSECSSLFTEFETQQVDFSTWRYIHKDLDLEFEIKSTPALEAAEEQNLYRFLWIKRGSVVPRFLEHKFEFSETMFEKFREKVLENVMPYLQGQE